MTTESRAQIQFQSSQSQSSLLRTTLRTNAVFSIISGGLMILASAGIAAFLGIADATILGFLSGSSFILVLGIGVLLFGLGVLYDVTRPEFSRLYATAILVGDIVWVVASAILLLTHALPLSTAGNWTVLIVADIVTVFAIAEYIGLRRLSRNI